MYDSLSNVEMVKVALNDYLDTESITKRIKVLNKFFSELIVIESKLECISNFFNKDFTFKMNLN